MRERAALSTHECRLDKLPCQYELYCQTRYLSLWELKMKMSPELNRRQRGSQGFQLRSGDVHFVSAESKKRVVNIADHLRGDLPEYFMASLIVWQRDMAHRRDVIRSRRSASAIVLSPQFCGRLD